MCRRQTRSSSSAARTCWCGSLAVAMRRHARRFGAPVAASNWQSCCCTAAAWMKAYGCSSNRTVGSARRLRTCVGTAATPPEAGTSLGPLPPLRCILHRLQLDMNAITQLATMTLTCRQEGPGFFRRFGLDTPLLEACYSHGGVERIQACFRFGDEHPNLANQRDSES